MAIYFPNSQLENVATETWRITSSFTGDNNLMGGNSLINWEKSDDVYGGTSLASGSILSHSNGQFTFNSDLYGWYNVHWWHYNYHTVDCRYNEMSLYVSWNSGSDWDVHGYTTSHITIGTNGNNHASGAANSTVLGNSVARLRFGMNVENNSVTTGGSTSESLTGFTVTLIAKQ